MIIIDTFIKKFWDIVNEEYDYKDMLNFDEIQSIFDTINESKNIDNTKIAYGHNLVGPTATIQLVYNDMGDFEIPESCHKCPFGFMTSCDCGRETPLTSIGRSPNCKLEKRYIEIK